MPFQQSGLNECALLKINEISATVRHCMIENDHIKELEHNVTMCTINMMISGPIKT